MADVARPGHLRDVHEPLDPALEFDEGPVVGDRHHPPEHARSDRVFLGHVLPRVFLKLLETERDSFAVPVDVEDLDLDRLSDVADFRRMSDPAPRHVGDVEKAVHPAEIDEGAEVRDVLDHPGPDVADREFLLQLIALAGPLFLEEHSPADHDVPAALVQLEDLELVFVADEVVDVRYPTERDLGSGQERVHAHEVDGHATLDLALDAPIDRTIVVEGVLDLLPDAKEIRLLLGQHDDALVVFEALQEDIHRIARLHRVRVLELVQRHGPLGLEPDIEDDVGLRPADDLGARRSPIPP